MGVHMIFNGNFEDAWEPDEKRESKLVFIGKNLNHDELKAAFTACAESEDLKQKKIQALRFGIGDKVKCNTGDGWQKGEVVKLMYRDEHMPPGMVAPYQVKLEPNGNLIYAPQDLDELIQKA